MYTTKQTYIAPTTDVIAIRCNCTLMASDFTLNNPQQGNTNWWPDDENEG